MNDLWKSGNELWTSVMEALHQIERLRDETMLTASKTKDVMNREVLLQQVAGLDMALDILDKEVLK